MNKKIYNLAICGCGPAGMSPLLHLEENKLLEKYLDEGICIIDQKEKIGAGKIINYDITANTLGKIFLDFSSEKNSDLYQYIVKKDSYKIIESKLEEVPYLKEVGNLLEDIGTYFFYKISSHNNSDVYNNHQILEIKKNREDLFEIKIQSSSKKDKTILARHIIFNIGGKQKETLEKEENVIYSDDFISGLHDELVNKILNLNSEIIISIIGGSHSTFSALYRLKNHFELLNKDKLKVQIFNRSNIRLFYNSIEEAINDHYKFDMEQDVCFSSNSVNRYSGLRFDSFVLAKECMNYNYSNVKIMNKSLDREDFMNSDLIINATGYTNNIVKILDCNNEEITFKLEYKQLLTDYYCRPYIYDSSSVFDRFYTYGLGAGMKPDPKKGGEAHYNGRIDAIWLYQHESAKRVLEDVSCSFYEKAKS